VQFELAPAAASTLAVRIAQGDVDGIRVLSPAEDGDTPDTDQPPT
jgi:hypothetical protein